MGLLASSLTHRRRRVRDNPMSAASWTGPPRSLILCCRSSGRWSTFRSWTTQWWCHSWTPTGRGSD